MQLLSLRWLIIAGVSVSASGTASAHPPAVGTAIERLDAYASVAQQVSELKGAIAGGEPRRSARAVVAQKDFRLMASMVGVSSRPTALPGVWCTIVSNDTAPFRAVASLAYAWQTERDPDQAQRNQLLTEYMTLFNQAVVGSQDYPDYDICRSKSSSDQERPSAETTKQQLQQKIAREAALAQAPKSDRRPAETADVIHAARFGRIEALKALLATRPNIEARDVWRMTALAWAAARGQTEAAKLLLDAGANPNLRAGPVGRTPLMFAILSENEAIAELLLTRGADAKSAVQIESPIRRTACCSYPLTLAAALNRPVLIARLIKRGADANVYDAQDYATPLAIAAILGHRAAAIALLDAGAKIEFETATGSRYKISAFSAAAEGGEVAMMELLAARGADINWTDDDGSTSALHAALYENRKAAVDWLLAHGADVNVGADNRKYGVYRYSTQSALGTAIAGSTLGADVVRALLARGADVHERQGYPLVEPLFLAMWTDAETILALLDAGADLGARDSQGRTPLHLLSETDSKPNFAVSPLKRRGADINAQDYAGNTPLNTQPCNHPAVVNELLAAGADPNIPNKEGRTPIFDALRCEPVFRALLATGAKLNIRDKDGVTPRQIIEHNGLEYLLEPPKAVAPSNSAP